MSSATVDGDITSVMAPAHELLDGLLSAPLDLWTDDEVMAVWRDVHRVVNRFAAVDHVFIARAESSGMPQAQGAKNTAAFLRGLLRIDGYDAAARVRGAHAAAARTSLTGEPVQAPYVHVAAAQAAGDISPKHAAVVVAAAERLSEELRAEHGVQVEKDLVGFASQFDPRDLAKLGLRMTTLLDQDGTLCEATQRERNRSLLVHLRPDGSSTIQGEATAELTARLLVLLDSMAKPGPEADGVKDPRTPGQRNHDALSDALDLVQRAELLPDAGGVSATVILSTTQDEWASGEGVATTGHGAVLAIPDARRLAGSAARVITVTTDSVGAITDWTDARRLFTECQRLALIARDGGCCFPGCDTPPAWCQAAHIVDWIAGGPTTVDNGMLLCGHHHRNYERLGWKPISRDGRPAWIPPPWIDPEQRPHRNAHHSLN